MFPESLALTNHPKQFQQTFDVKFQPPQAIMIEKLQPRSRLDNYVSQQPQKTEFERKMFEMQLLAKRKIRELSRSDEQTNAVEQIIGGENNLILEKGRESENVANSLKPQNQTETKVEETNLTEIVRLKKTLESQLSELESILDAKKGRKQNIAKKPTQIEDKELTSKINKILISLLREISLLERQIMHFEIGSKPSDLAQKLLSTYQFSMSFFQTYHNEYSAKLSKSSQENFKEKIAKLTKSLTNCASQLSEFPNFDFPMPDLPFKPQKPIIRHPPIPQKKNKTSNPKKAAVLQKRHSKISKMPKPFEKSIPDENRCFVRKSNHNTNSENIAPNFSSDESIISFLASKPGHSRLTSPSNSRAQLEAIPPVFLSKHQAPSSINPSQITSSNLYIVINDFSQEMIEELIDEQISEVLNSIELSQVVSEGTHMSHLKPLPEVIEDLDYYLSAINSYEDLLAKVEKNLRSDEESVEVLVQEKPKIPQEISYEEKGMIIIPQPEHFTEETKDKGKIIEYSFPEKVKQKKRPIDPVLIQDLSDDRYKMMRYNRMHQPSIRLALKHNLLERMKDEILNSSMDNVAQQIFKTLDNYVEKNFFDEFLKTPETLNFVQNILRKTEDRNPIVPITKSTQGVQTDQRSKNVQIQSVLASPTPSNSPLSSQVYSSDFSSYSLRTERSSSDVGVLSGNSEISLQISEHSIEIPSQIISSAEQIMRKGNEIVYGVSITEQISEISIDIPTLSHESPLPANDPISSPDSQTPIGSSIYISRAVTELKTVSEAQLSLARSGKSASEQSPASAATASSSEGADLSEVAYSSVLCLDVESMLPLATPTEYETASPPTDSQSDTEQAHEYSDTFTQSNSTLYSLSETQIKEAMGAPAPLTPIFQDSLDSSRTLAHSASSRSASAVTESIEEEISDF